MEYVDTLTNLTPGCSHYVAAAIGLGEVRDVMARAWLNKKIFGLEFELKPSLSFFSCSSSILVEHLRLAFSSSTVHKKFDNVKFELELNSL